MHKNERTEYAYEMWLNLTSFTTINCLMPRNATPLFDVARNLGGLFDKKHTQKEVWDSFN